MIAPVVGARACITKLVACIDFFSGPLNATAVLPLIVSFSVWEPFRASLFSLFIQVSKEGARDEEKVRNFRIYGRVAAYGRGGITVSTAHQANIYETRYRCCVKDGRRGVAL